MKKMLLILVGGFLVQQAMAETPPTLSDYDTVRSTEWFSIGATGAGATISDTEIAFRKIVKAPEAKENCQKLAVEGTLAGRLYGVLGLKLLQDPTYQKASLPLRASREVVTVTDACALIKRPAFFVFQGIDQGRIR